MSISRYYIKTCAAVVALFTLCGCDMNTMQPQDIAFVGKIQQTLKSEGNRIKVSELHQGDWQRVCFTAMGAKDDAVQAISEAEGIPESDVDVINRPRSEAGHGDDFDWGIYFFYAPNKIEYFEISLSVMAAGSFSREALHTKCANKDQAYFVADKIVIDNKDEKFLQLGLATHPK